MNQGQNSIVWFRKALRLHDNFPLIEACKNSENIFPLFILDPNFKDLNIGLNRWRFLFQSLQDLDQQLQNKDSQLYIAKGKPVQVFTDLMKKWAITDLYFEVDTEPYAKIRDSEIEKLCSQMKIKVTKIYGHTLYDQEKLFNIANNQIPLTYAAFQKILAKAGIPDRPQEIPSLIKTPRIDGMLLPSLEEYGLDISELGPTLYPGGETEAIKRLDQKLKDEDWVRKFEKPKTEPNSLRPSTTVLSPYLKFGCLSPRLFYHRVQDVYSRGKHSEPPTSLIGQLIWREFFYYVGSQTKNFDRIEGNIICKQIQWDDDAQLFKKWRNAETGFPFIDAIMTQLRLEGWIHHLGRHAVACFLTRGDLYQSWVKGASVFDEWLLDADWSLNNANWMWLSCSSFFYQYYRVYSPVAFGRSTDHNGDYIRKYIPVLCKFPKEFIYEPWKAPINVQQKCGCIIGKDYPFPIVDHDEAKKICMGKMKQVYSQGKQEKQEDNSIVQYQAVKKIKK